MIDRITLSNFKCFEAQSIELRSLTLLAGLNSSGKSTIIQSLLLLRQSFLEQLLPGVGLTLNGKLVQLGAAKDVLFEEAAADEIGFSLYDDFPASVEIECAYQEEADVLELSGIVESSAAVWKTNLFREDFRYLQAERVGPRTSFAMSDYEVRRQRQIGTAGEYAAQYVSLFGSAAVESERLRHPDAVSNTLQSQVEAWVGEISPGVRLHFRRYSEMDLIGFSVSYSLGHSVASSEYRSTNVGFGVTYGLPMVVATLSASRGSLLIIENPEAHLHPRGQVKMGELLARAAAGGVQVIVETHSDHILNGIRLAVRDQAIAPHEVALYHSAWSSGATSPEVTMVEVDRNGKLSEWPEGFFDEIERSLDRLIGDDV